MESALADIYDASGYAITQSSKPDPTAYLRKMNGRRRDLPVGFVV